MNPNRHYLLQQGTKCVAVVYHAGYGCPWSKYHNSEILREILIFDKDIVSLVESKKVDAFSLHSLVDSLIKRYSLQEKLAKELENKFNHLDDFMLEKLCVEYVPEGSIFKIVDFDGYERIEYIYLEDRAYKA